MLTKELILTLSGTHLFISGLLSVGLSYCPSLLTETITEQQQQVSEKSRNVRQNTIVKHCPMKILIATFWHEYWIFQKISSRTSIWG
jgi:hypothetical protein